jgi:hypothetical protein
MRITLNRHHRTRAQAALVCLIIVIVIFLIVIGSIFYIMTKTIKRTCPPHHGANGQLLPIGASCDGGTVAGYTTNPNGAYANGVTNSTFTLMIYADADLMKVLTNWQSCRCVYSQTFSGSSVGDALDQVYQGFINGVPMDIWPEGSKPPQQFYNILVSQ